jgi:hypothetical protein
MLKEITEKLLREENPGALKTASEELYSLFSSITAINDASTVTDDETETLLAHGKALSPKDAARCVLDFARTTKFLRGVHAAVLEAQKRFPNQKINVLYAGCGPFAPLAIPLCTEFTKEEIGFTLLDIHERSLSAARKIFETFELSAFAREFVQCNAVEYVFDKGMPLHIVVVEAMQKALVHEPQVAITLNLASQLCEGGLLVPQRIEVNACLAKLNEEFSLTASSSSESDVAGLARKRISLGRLLDLSAESADELWKSVQSDSSGNSYLPPRVIDVPDGLSGDYDLALLTKVTTFDSIALDDYESGVTYPTILHDLGSFSSKTKIEFQYALNQYPGFKYKRL